MRLFSREQLGVVIFLLAMGTLGSLVLYFSKRSILVKRFLSAYVFEEPKEDIWINIKGAVKTSKRIKLKEEATLGDLIARAGGLGEYADRGKINFYQRLFDGQTIYIQYSDLKEGEYLELNTADRLQLGRVPSINTSIAERIINYRRRYGRFDSLDELLDIKGIGQAKFNTIVKYLYIE